MYAILKHGGHQYRVTAGDRLLVDRLVAEVGSQVTLEPVLLVADGDAADVGTGAVAGARVLATVVAHRRGRKLRVFTFKPKKRHRRTLGYRSQLTELRIDEVATGSAAPAKRRTAQPADAQPAKAAADQEAPAATAEAPPANAEAPATAQAAAETAGGSEASPAESPAGEAPAPEPAETAEPPRKRAARTRRRADGA